MRTVYLTLVNMLLFFFIAEIFGGALLINRGEVIDKIVVGIIFGFFMAMVPHILKFFKLPVNGGSLFLMSLIVAFLFFFLGLYIFNFITITGKSIALGISLLDPIVLPDRTFALVTLTLVTALSSVGLSVIDKRK